MLNAIVMIYKIVWNGRNLNLVTPSRKLEKPQGCGMKISIRTIKYISTKFDENQIFLTIYQKGVGHSTASDNIFHNWSYESLLYKYICSNLLHGDYSCYIYNFVSIYFRIHISWNLKVETTEVVDKVIM